MENKQISLLISYGHDDYKQFAEDLAAYLHKKNYYVWIDYEQIKPSDIWDIKIESGLNKIRHDRPDSRFIYIMSNRSTDMKDGFCRNELIKALDMDLPILPLKIQNVAPPLVIYSYQFLDCCSYWQDNSNESKEVIFEKIHSSLQDPQIKLDISGVHNQLKNLLAPMDFSSDLYRLLKNYEKREWITEQINEWLDKEEAPNMLCILGGPGYGKSAVAANIIRSDDRVIASHICVRQSDKSNIRNIICTLAFQIASQIPAYMNELMEICARPDAEQFLSAEGSILFDRLISDPLGHFQINPDLKNKRSLIVIDALDEADDEGQTIAYILGQKKTSLPPWLRIVVTSRKIKHITACLSDCMFLDMENNETSNKVDLSNYIDKQLFNKFGSSSNYVNAKEQIMKNANGVFLYVARMCECIKAGLLSIDEPTNYPVSLNQYYIGYFTSKFKDKQNYQKQVGKFLALITAAKEPLSVEMAAECLGVEEDEVNNWIVELGDFFRVDRERIGYYHASIMDWLLNGDYSGEYQVQPRMGNSLFAELSYDAPVCYDLSRYMSRHLIKHLCDLGQKKEIEKLLNDVEYCKNLDEWDREGVVIGIYFENLFYLRDYYIKHKYPVEQFESLVFNSALFEHILIRYRLYLFDWNYFKQVEQLGFTNFLGNNKFKKLSLMLRINTISYYYVLGRFDLLMRLDFDVAAVAEAIVEEWKKEYADEERLQQLANGLNLLGVSYRICGKFEQAEKLLTTSIDLYKRLDDTDCANVVTIDLVRVYKMTGDDEKAEKLLAETYAECLNMLNDLPETYGITHEKVLHVMNGSVSASWEYNMDQMKLTEAEDNYAKMSMFYTFDEAKKERYYPVYILQLARMRLLEGRVDECIRLLNLSERYPERTPFRMHITISLKLYQYYNEGHDLNRVREAKEICEELMSMQARSSQWEKYAAVTCLYRLCAEILDFKVELHPDFSDDVFKHWIAYKERCYQKIFGLDKVQN